LERGQSAIASRHVHAVSQIADRLRQPPFRWYARLMEGMLSFLRGDLDEADRLCTLAMADGRAAGSANCQMVADGGQKMAILRERGEIDLCRQIYEQAIA